MLCVIYNYTNKYMGHFLKKDFLQIPCTWCFFTKSQYTFFYRNYIPKYIKEKFFWKTQPNFTLPSLLNSIPYDSSAVITLKNILQNLFRCVQKHFIWRFSSFMFLFGGSKIAGYKVSSDSGFALSSSAAACPRVPIPTLPSLLEAALLSRADSGWELFACSLSSHPPTAPRQPEHPDCLEPGEHRKTL